jgi:outer membrane protein TolC
VPADYDVAGDFEYRPLAVTLEELQAKALQNRPDLRAAVLGVTAANSQYALAKANGKQDPTISGNYSHVNGISGSPGRSAFRWRFSTGTRATLRRRALPSGRRRSSRRRPAGRC